ncbi:hypothetical protein AB4Z18_13405 [Leifsonia sp. 2TAF2]|uniref:hypothetical protein n=1 Tax=Leifsonia sp. 2TAF2 TaxID=3233009 RepID=UPI003F9482C5
MDEGMSRSRLYRDADSRPFRGVRWRSGERLEHVAKCRAYALLEREGHLFSHHSAALIHRLPLSHAHFPSEVHVATFAPAKPPQMKGVVAHELRPAGHRIVDVDGLRAFSPEDAWAQLSSTVSVTELVVIGDFIVTGNEPFSGDRSHGTKDDLARALRHHARRPGIQRLRQAIDLVRFGSLSPQETRLRLALVDAGLPEPELNFRVLDRGRRIAMVDLAYSAERVAIEYLGDHHRTDQATYQEDINRRERLTAGGWDTVFITAADLRDPVPRAVLLVRRALVRAPSPRPIQQLLSFSG